MHHPRVCMHLCVLLRRRRLLAVVVASLARGLCQCSGARCRCGRWPQCHPNRAPAECWPCVDRVCRACWQVRGRQKQLHVHGAKTYAFHRPVPAPARPAPKCQRSCQRSCQLYQHDMSQCQHQNASAVVPALMPAWHEPMTMCRPRADCLLTADHELTVRWLRADNARPRMEHGQGRAGELLGGKPGFRQPLLQHYSTSPCKVGVPWHKWRERCLVGEPARHNRAQVRAAMVKLYPSTTRAVSLWCTTYLHPLAAACAGPGGHGQDPRPDCAVHRGDALPLLRGPRRPHAGTK